MEEKRARIADALPFSRRHWVRTWLSTAALGTLLLGVLFVGYEVVERRWLLQVLSASQIHQAHILRGLTASVLVGTWAFLNVWRTRAAYDAAFTRAYDELHRAFDARTGELVRTQAQLRDQEKLAALGVLSSGIAHDIANPLASISSELEMLEGEEDLERVRQSLVTLRHHVERIDRTLREMTGFARRRGDQASAVLVPDVVEDALRLVRHDRRAMRARLRTELSPDLRPVRIVEDHLVMVLVNLLLNALDALPEGGGEIVVRAANDGEHVRLAVSDDGAGMSDEVRRAACEPFFTTKGSGRGTGLGLFLAADVLRSAGGALEIDSSLGRGTTVRLTCPTVRDPAHTGRSPCPSAS